VDTILKLLLIPIVSISLFAQTPITPIPENAIYSVVKAELGKRLFNDPILSNENKISCSSCHNLSKGGADSVPFSKAMHGRETRVNTPTLFNASLNFVQHLDGGVQSLKDELISSIENPLKMDTSFNEIIGKISSSSYKSSFDTIYPDGVTRDNVIDAIVEFEKALLTPNSKFDRYLKGDSRALTKEERLGYEKFQSTGCINCHNGVNVGGNMYQKMGVYTSYTQKKISKGRVEVTGRDRDLYVYKVPSLRNIALTAPYMHDGQVMDKLKHLERL